MGQPVLRIAKDKLRYGVVVGACSEGEEWRWWALENEPWSGGEHVHQLGWSCSEHWMTAYTFLYHF